MSHPPYTGYNFVDTLCHDIYPAINPTKSELSQPSKVVLITGPGRGIGRSIALRYLESSVECIIICPRKASELEDVEQAIKKIDLHFRVHRFTLDITGEAKVFAVAEAVKKEEGRLDILVNNTGTVDPWKLIIDGVADEYWRTVTVNLKGPYLLMNLFCP
jgi:NAD(P)-dependent dehydrogenase (short-subunit alcohol dehydrogenase family)